MMEVAVTVPLKAVPDRAPTAKTLSKSREKRDFPAELLAAPTSLIDGIFQDRYDPSYTREAGAGRPSRPAEESGVALPAHQETNPLVEAPAMPSLCSEGGQPENGGNVFLPAGRPGTGREDGIVWEAVSNPSPGWQRESIPGTATVSSFDPAAESHYPGNAGERGLLPAEVFAAAERAGMAGGPEEISREELVSWELLEQRTLPPGYPSAPEGEISPLTGEEEGAEVDVAGGDFSLYFSEAGRELVADSAIAFNRGKMEQGSGGREFGDLAAEDGYSLMTSGLKASTLTAVAKAGSGNFKEVVFRPLLTAVRLQKGRVPGDGEIRVNLKPDYLGEVSIRLIRQGGLMKGMITVGNALVREVIEAHLPEFKQRLAEQNLFLEELTVFLHDSGAGQSGNGFRCFWQDGFYPYSSPGEQRAARAVPAAGELSPGGLNVLV